MYDATPPTTTPDDITLDVDALVNADDQETLEMVVDFHHQHLLASTELRHYLGTKRLNNDEVISHFRLGYANRTLGLQLLLKVLKAGKIIRDRLARLGIYRSTDREHLNGSLVVPITDLDGQIVELYGRKVLGQRLHKGTPLDLFITDSPRGVFNLDVFPHSDELVVCASFVDAMTLWSLGIRHVTVTFSDEGLHPELLTALGGHDIQRVMLAYPRRTEFEAAVTRSTESLVFLGIESFRAMFPKDMTVNQFCVRTDGNVERIAEVLRHSDW